MLLYRCLMTIYIKSRGGQVLVVKQRLCHIFRKVILYGYSVTNLVTCIPNCYQSNTLYGWHNDSIIQKPHDHLYQKSLVPILPVYSKDRVTNSEN